MGRHLLKFPTAGFTLLELILSVGILALLAGISLGGAKELPHFLFPFEKANALQLLRLTQISSLTTGKGHIANLSGKTIYFASSGVPQPGSSGTFSLKAKSGKIFSVILSSMGRIRIP